MTREAKPQRPQDTDLLATGEAAAVLGTSRQHVVDLCDAGTLSCTRVGTYRRVRRDDLVRLQEGEPKRDALTRDQLRSLWLHQAVAGQLLVDPASTLMRARSNLTRLQAAHRRGIAAQQLGEWERLLEAPMNELLVALTSRLGRASYAGTLPLPAY